MKKIIVLLIILFLVTGCSNNRVISNLGLNKDNCRVLEEKDTHGGFLGDGDYFARIKCSKIEDKLNKRWKELPISDELKEVTEMEHCDSKSCEDIYKRYNIPNVKNGYYYFKDRHSESTNTYDDTDINNRSSYNFTFAILDKDTNMIYYYELDT
ncbi:MAG: lipoprotein [Bacilli bacterium]|nr:lipoprotein [Bacilli bacterium]